MNAVRRPTPTFEGRPLVRPDDEVVDQGLGFDVVTLIGRRQMLRALGLGAVAIGVAACSSDGNTSGPSTAGTTSGTTASGASVRSGTLAEIPDETAGPYPGDGSNGADVLEQSGIVRSDLRSSFGESTGTAEGVPMTLTLTILDLANGGAPFVGVAVYVWHCDRAGAYSMYSDGITDQNYLRGVQVSDANGRVTFTSIFPACYSGRWPHIHFEVYPDEASITDATNAIATSQVALPQHVCELVYATTGYEASVANLSQVTLQTDNVFSDDGGALQLATATGDVTAGYAVALTAAVDTATSPTAGSAPAGGTGAGPAGGTGGQPPSGERPTGEMPAAGMPSGEIPTGAMPSAAPSTMATTSG